MKYRFLLSLVLITLVFIALPLVGGAQEVNYPDFPGTNPPGPNTNIAQFLQYLYRILLIVGTGIAIAVVIIAGFRYLTSAGDVGKMKDARNRLTFAVAGLLLLWGSALLLNTIDPNLTITTLNSLPNAPRPPQNTRNIPENEPEPGSVETITDLEENTDQLADYLSARADKVIATADKAEELYQDLKWAHKRECAQTNAFCVPKGLKPVPVACKWERPNIEKEILEHIGNDNLKGLREAFTELHTTRMAQDLRGTVERIRGCLSSFNAQLSIDAQVRASGALDDFAASPGDPLDFYCFR